MVRRCNFVVATSHPLPARDGELFDSRGGAKMHPRMHSFAVEAPTMQSELLLLLRHGPQRTLTSEQTPKLHTDVEQGCNLDSDRLTLSIFLQRIHKMWGCMHAYAVYGFYEKIDGSILSAAARKELNLDMFALCTIRNHVDVVIYGVLCNIVDDRLIVSAEQKAVVDAAFGRYCTAHSCSAYEDPDGENMTQPRYMVCVSGQIDTHECSTYEL